MQAWESAVCAADLRFDGDRPTQHAPAPTACRYSLVHQVKVLGTACPQTRYRTAPARPDLGRESKDPEQYPTFGARATVFWQVLADLNAAAHFSSNQANSATIDCHTVGTFSYCMIQCGLERNILSD